MAEKSIEAVPDWDTHSLPFLVTWFVKMCSNADERRLRSCSSSGVKLDGERCIGFLSTCWFEFSTVICKEIHVWCENTHTTYGMKQLQGIGP